jgi:hypothetical protein
MFIPLNPNAYSPNTENKGSPKQANQTVGKGFFTAPERTASGKLQRTLSTTFEDNWSQPRLFWNSLVDAEKQFIVDAMRFETSNVKSSVVRNNVIIQLNRISNDLATRVAKAIGVEAPKPDSSFYHDNTTAHIGALDGLKVGLLASGISLLLLRRARSCSLLFLLRALMLSLLRREWPMMLIRLTLLLTPCSSMLLLLLMVRRVCLALSLSLVSLPRVPVRRLCTPLVGLWIFCSMLSGSVRLLVRWVRALMLCSLDRFLPSVRVCTLARTLGMPLPRISRRVLAPSSSWIGLPLTSKGRRLPTYR